MANLRVILALYFGLFLILTLAFLAVLHYNDINEAAWHFRGCPLISEKLLRPCMCHSSNNDSLNMATNCERWCIEYGCEIEREAGCVGDRTVLQSNTYIIFDRHSNYCDQSNREFSYNPIIDIGCMVYGCGFGQDHKIPAELHEYSE